MKTTTEPPVEVTIYKNEEAKKVCELILDTDYNTPIKGYDHLSRGFWKECPGLWVAFDNSTGHCWVEEFKTRKEAVAYVKNEM